MPKIDLPVLGGVEMFGSGLGVKAHWRFCCWICRSNSCCSRATCLFICWIPIPLDLLLETCCLREPRGEAQGPVAEAQGPVAEVQGNVAEAQGPMAEVQGPVAEVQGPVAEVQGLWLRCRGLWLRCRGLWLTRRACGWGAGAGGWSAGAFSWDAGPLADVQGLWLMFWADTMFFTRRSLILLLLFTYWSNPSASFSMSIGTGMASTGSSSERKNK